MISFIGQNKTFRMQRIPESTRYTRKGTVEEDIILYLSIYSLGTSFF